MALAGLLTLLGGGVAKEIRGAISDWQRAKTEHERSEAMQRVEHLKAVRDVQVAETKWWFATAFRVFLSLPVALYFWKALAIDKLFCATCRTDPLGTDLRIYTTAVLGYWLWTFVKK